MEYEPRHIKSTPPELGVPSHEIEWNSEAKVLAATTYNPGVPDNVFRKLAEKVVSELKPLNSKQWRTHLVYLAERYMTQTATEKIENKTQEATHKIIDGAHLFTGYDLPDPDDQYRGPNGAA